MKRLTASARGFAGWQARKFKRLLTDPQGEAPKLVLQQADLLCAEWAP